MERYSYRSFTIIAGMQFYLILLLFGVGCGGPRHMMVPASSNIPFGQGTTPVKFSDASIRRSPANPSLHPASW